MQDKRRRNDFASTEVGEVKGGRVTQQAFEVADKKDSGISDAAMPGTRGDGRKDAKENAPPLGKEPALSPPPSLRSLRFRDGSRRKGGKAEHHAGAGI